MKHKGILIVVSGFSGAGKGTLMKKLIQEYDNYALSISATTRAPRPGEEDGREYFFKTVEEFEQMIPQVICTSATPGDYELGKTDNKIIEQIIRPTGLLDPIVEVRPKEGQIDDIINEIHDRASKNERTLILTLTIRMAEDLTEYLKRQSKNSSAVSNSLGKVNPSTLMDFTFTTPFSVIFIFS